MTAMIALMGGILLAQEVAEAPDDLELQVRRLVRQLDARQSGDVSQSGIQTAAPNEVGDLLGTD